MKNIISKHSIIIAAVLSAVLFSFCFGYAQDINIDSMSNQELSTLLQQILQKMEEGNSVGTDPERTETIAGPRAEPGTETEMPGIQVYLNKKLIIESLPSYMFIEPETKEENQGSDENVNKGSEKDKKDDNACPPISLCKPPDIYCTYWITPEGKCVCMCG